MTFKLMMSAQGNWRKLDRLNCMPEIVQGIACIDAIKPTQPVG